VLVEGRKLFLSAASAIERDAWCVRVWTRALSPIALPPPRMTTIAMRQQRWQYVKKSTAVGQAPDARLVHLLSGCSETSVDLCALPCTLEKVSEC
jgi:hypothetical protein